jgi:23S rRNA (guanosine2251-2'-O)-methyltransferase
MLICHWLVDAVIPMRISSSRPPAEIHGDTGRRRIAAVPAVATNAARRHAPSQRHHQPVGRQGPGATESWIYGRHAVSAALANPRRHWRVLVALAGQENEARQLVAGARAAQRGAAAPVRVLDRAGFAAMLPEGAVHQGLALAVEPLAEPDLDELLRGVAAAPRRQVVVVLDQVADPHNVGAVLRSAAAFGAAAVLVTRRNSPAASGALAKAASGALDCLPLVRVVNLARALDALKRAGFWICGLDEGATTPLSALDLGERAALVLGSEGGGLRRLVAACCDHLARLPTLSAQPTLNVSNAAAVALYELARGRSLPRSADGPAGAPEKERAPDRGSFEGLRQPGDQQPPISDNATQAAAAGRVATGGAGA